MQSTSPRKNRRRKRRQNAKSQRRNRPKPSSRREKSQRPKLPLRDKRNPRCHRPKNRSRKSGVGSGESQTIPEIGWRGVRAVGIERLRLKRGEVREILWPSYRSLILDQRVPAKGENRNA